MNTAFAGLAPAVRFAAAPAGEAIALTIDLHDEADALVFRLEAAIVLSADDPARLAAYAAAVADRVATARSPDERRALLDPSSFLLTSVLADGALRTRADFAALLADPERLARAERAEAVGMLLGQVPDDDDALALWYALCPEGRAELGWDASAAALRALVLAGAIPLLVEAMERWAEEYDPWEVPWDGGPEVTQLLILGAWEGIAPRAAGELRARALRVVDRIPDEGRPAAADLQRAGLAG